MKIALITDLHAEENYDTKYGVDVWKNWEIVLADVKKRNINRMVFLGDIGSKAAHSRLFESLNGYNYRFVLGNHDNFSEVSQSYRSPLVIDKKEWYWSEEEEQFKWIGLDTSSNTISQDQLDFLQHEIQTEKPILLFIHHPVLTTHTTPHREFPLDGDNKVKEILLKHSNIVNIYCGHLHMDDIQAEGNIKQTITPAASFQLKKQSEKTEIDAIGFGYNILDLNDPQISSEVVWFKA